MAFRLTSNALPATTRSGLDEICKAVARSLPVSHEQRQADFQAAMRYRSALQGWYARLFSAARRNEAFDRPRPEPHDFSTSRYGAD